jgi:hypothetical protein
MAGMTLIVAVSEAARLATHPAMIILVFILLIFILLIRQHF